MKKLLMAAAIAISALTVSVPAQAQDRTIGGAVVGGVAGAVIAGPVGLLVGGVTGAVVGNNMERPRRVCWTNRRGNRTCRWR